MPQYRMDNATFDHLVAWTERVSVDPEDAEALQEALIHYLESQEVEDAEYSLSHGWPHVRSLVED